MFLKCLTLPLVLSVVPFVVVISSKLVSSQAQSTSSSTNSPSGVTRGNVDLDRARGTIVYRRRANTNASEGLLANPDKTSNKALRQVAVSRRDRQNRNPSAISRNFSPGACQCMGYWDCIANNGHVYSYCGISDSEVCCFHRRMNKDVRHNNGSSVNNNDIIAGSAFVETNKESPTTATSTSRFAEEELLTTGNEFGEITSTPATFPSTLLPSTLPDVEYFYSLENGNGNLQRIKTKVNHNDKTFDKFCGRQAINWKLDSQAEFKEWPWHSLVDRIIVHPDYNNATLVNDIAIVTLKTPLNYTTHIRPICLPSSMEKQQFERIPRKKCVVPGWGRLSETSPFSVKLKEIVVPLWDHQECQEQLRRNFGNSYRLSRTAICAGERGHDACDGDGGGGMVCFNEEQKHWSLQGIVSFGIGCGRIDNPGVYTSVLDFVKWISAFDYLQ